MSRDRLAVAAGLVAPLALAAILAPFRTSFANTDAALAMILIIVAVAAAGNRLAGLTTSRLTGCQAVPGRYCWSRAAAGCRAGS